ncbi:FHA domain-containing protein [Planctomycetota bacterium]
MKKKTILSMLLLTAFSNSLWAQASPPEQKPVALTIILDTSWSCERELSNFASLARKAVSSSLNPGDDLEIITAHSGNPKIRLSQTIRSGSPQEITSITTVLTRVRSGFLSNANVSRALEMAIQRLDNPWPQKKYQNAAVIIFSDGKLSNNDAGRIVRLSTELIKRGWSLYMTGTRTTNKKLLVAASQNRLNWSLITDANPSAWLQDLHTSPTEEKQSVTSTYPDKIMIIKEQTKEQEPELVISVKDKETESADEEQAEEKQSESVEWLTPEDNEVPVIEPLLKEQEKSAQVSQQHLAESEQKKDRVEVRTVVDSRVSIAPSDEKTATIEVLLPEEQTQEVNEPLPEEFEEFEAKQQTILPEPNIPVEIEQKSKPKSALGKILWWILIPIAGLLVLIGLVLFMGLRNANQWKQRVGSHLKKSERQGSGVLLAKLNGQAYRLGQWDRFKAAHVGKDTNNSIRVTGDKSIEDRHLRIYKKGNDLWLRNMARTSVVANGTEIKSRHKHRLVVPAVIQLSEKTKLSLELLRQKTKAPENRRTEHESEKK